MCPQRGTLTTEQLIHIAIAEEPPMPDIRAVVPSALLFCLVITTLILLGDEPSEIQLARALESVFQPTHAQVVANVDSEASRWVDPPHRVSNERRHEALALSEEPAED